MPLHLIAMPHFLQPDMPEMQLSGSIPTPEIVDLRNLIDKSSAQAQGFEAIFKDQSAIFFKAMPAEKRITTN